MRASKRIPILAVLIVFSLGAGFLCGQSKPSESRHEIRLRFKSNFFMTPGQDSTASGKDTKPEIVLFARNGDSGLGPNVTRELENLKKFFGIKDLAAGKESEELEISAESWAEMKKTQPKAAHTALMNSKGHALAENHGERHEQGNLVEFRRTAGHRLLLRRESLFCHLYDRLWVVLLRRALGRRHDLDALNLSLLQPFLSLLRL